MILTISLNTDNSSSDIDKLYGNKRRNVVLNDNSYKDSQIDEAKVCLIIIIINNTTTITRKKTTTTTIITTLARQPCVDPALPQNCSSFFFIRYHTLPVSYAQNSDVLSHTFFPSQSWSSQFPRFFWFGIKYLLLSLCSE